MLGTSIRGLAIAAVTLFVSAPLARAVVTNDSNISYTRSAPVNFPDWDYVSRLGNASAVYLGDRWMVSAAHVSLGTVLFNDGRMFQIVPGSDVQLVNPASLGSTVGGTGTDLQMFQLTTDPGMALLPIATTSPATSQYVTMIGAGLDRSTTISGWSISSTTGNWTQMPLPESEVQGYQLLSTSHMAWGLNRVASGETVISNSSGSSVAFSTGFSTHSGVFLGQATTGIPAAAFSARSTADGNWWV